MTKSSLKYVFFVILSCTPIYSKATEIVEAMKMSVSEGALSKSGKYAELSKKASLISEGLSPFMPTLSYQISGALDSKTVAKSGAVVRAENAYAKTLTLSQSIFSGGSGLLGFAKANLLNKSAELTYIQTKQNIALDAAKTYLEVLSSMEMSKLAEKQVEGIAEYYKFMKKRFDLGTVTKADMQQTEVRLNLAKAQKINADGKARESVSMYKHKIGINPENLSYPKSFPPIPPSSENTLNLALEENIYLQIAFLNKSAASKNIGIAVANMAPQVSLSISKTDKSEVSSMTKEETVVGLNATFPILQGGRAIGALAQSSYIARQSEYDYIEAYETVTEQAISAWDSMISAQSLVEASKKGVIAAETALKSVKREEELGIKTNIEVLDAESDLFKSNSELVNAEKQYALSLYSISNLTGSRLLDYIENLDNTQPKIESVAEQHQ